MSTNQQPLSMWGHYQKGRRTFNEAGEEVKACFAFLRAVTHMLINVPTLVPEVFLHHSFGCRALTLGRVLAVFFLAVLLPSIVTVESPGQIAVFALIVAGAPIAALIHGAIASRRDRRGERWHSRCAGLPYARLWRHVPGARTPYIIMQYHEPALVVVVGVLVELALGGGLGAVIAATGLLLWTRWKIVADQTRAQVLDQIDQQIEGEVMAELVGEKRSEWESEGFIVPPAAIDLYADRPTVEDAMALVGEQLPATAPGAESEEEGGRGVHRNGLTGDGARAEDHEGTHEQPGTGPGSSRK